ncbi:MAG: metallophosphoesterase [Methanobacteriaceae archaeon]|nr:metallophosphoesterase [Candidatus Methanorudis spinitermitis]
MKILAISDVHAKENQGLYDYLKNNNLDLVIVSGDITNFGPPEFAEDFLNKISNFGATAIAIPGNCDTKEVFKKINKSKAICAHNDIIEHENLVIYGFGGSNPTPFDTPFEFDDDVLYDHLKKLFNSQKALKIGKKEENEEKKFEKLDILLTHAPPYGSEADIIEDGIHVGSEAVRKIIDEYQPRLNLCGHIHESVAFAMLGNTVIVNPGMLENGGGCLIQIDEYNNIVADMVEINRG